MKPKLTEAGFKAAAEALGVEVAVIKAVAEVESRGNGFLPDGRPVILFERHKFHRFTKGRFAAEHPDISNAKAGGYGRAGTHQWDRYDEAYDLDPQAAMKSASWGKFQIMGFNYKEAGFDSVDAFVMAMGESEDEQLRAFVNFVKANGLTDELQRRDWAGFADGYNGPDYKINKYDTKMAAAYRKHKRSPASSEVVTLPTDMPGDVSVQAVAADPDKITVGDVQGVVTGHADSAKSITARLGMKIAAFVATIWASGMHGKIFLLVLGLIVVVLVAYEVNKFWPKFKPWVVGLVKGAGNK